MAGGLQNNWIDLVALILGSIAGLIFTIWLYREMRSACTRDSSRMSVGDVITIILTSWWIWLACINLTSIVAHFLSRGPREIAQFLAHWIVLILFPLLFNSRFGIANIYWVAGVVMVLFVLFLRRHLQQNRLEDKARLSPGDILEEAKTALLFSILLLIPIYVKAGFMWIWINVTDHFMARSFVLIAYVIFVMVTLEGSFAAPACTVFCLRRPRLEDCVID